MSALDVIICLAPIGALVAASIGTSWSTGITLPLTAMATFLVRTMYLAMDPLVTSAAIVSGLHEALIPLSIIFGAVFLIHSMETSECMRFMTDKMVAVTCGDKISQLLLVGWSFMTLLEGCSGFGTPIIAIAPILVRLGHEKERAILFLLIGNCLVTTFGACGTPIWYGMGTVPVEDSILVQSGFIAACALGALTFLLLPIACFLATSKEETLREWRLIAFSAASGVLPMILTAYFSYTFPAIVAGAVGCVSTFVAVRMKHASSERASFELLKRSSPLILTVLLLLLSRIPQVGLKDLLTRTTPRVTAYLGTYGDMSISASLVFQLERILTTDVGFKFQLLFVPFILPFIIVGICTLVAFSCWKEIRRTFIDSGRQVVHPAQTLFGALVLVELMITGYDAPAQIIGDTISSAIGEAWLVIAPFIGSLGAFVAGSSTISNLTFGFVQYAAAINIEWHTATVLALQLVGASIGTAICIFHIVAAGAAIGEQVSVRSFMRKLGPLVLLGDIIAVGVCVGVGAIF